MEFTLIILLGSVLSLLKFLILSTLELCDHHTNESLPRFSLHKHMESGVWSVLRLTILGINTKNY